MDTSRVFLPKIANHVLEATEQTLWVRPRAGRVRQANTQTLLETVYVLIVNVVNFHPNLECRYVKIV